MYIPFTSSARKSYALLRPHDLERKNDENIQEERGIDDHHTKFPDFVVRFWPTLLMVIIGGSLGLLIGWHLPRKVQADVILDGLLRPAGTTIKTLYYNKTFVQQPSNSTEAAWRSLFPRGRGFFHHPASGVNISGLAVFHELHCLSAIRLGYYNALGEAANVQDFEDSTDPDAALDVLNTHVDPSHVRHCFDYLRQTLMCNADTNLEVIDWQIGGSTGWGFERQCRDYDKVVDWAERWRYRRGQEIDDYLDDPA